MSYLSEVLADSPIHYWRLADNLGLVARDIGSSRRDLPVDATALNFQPPASYSGPVSNGASKLYTSGGLKSFLGISSIPIPWSVEAITYLIDTVNGGGNMPILDWLNSGGTKTVTFEAFSSPFELRATGSLANINFGGSRQAWHHLALTDDGANSKGYLDGVLAGSTVSANTAVGGGQLAIGRYTGSIVGGAVWVTEVAFYGSALSSSRISAHYSSIDNLAIAPTAIGVAVTSDSALLAQIYDAVHRDLVQPGQQS